MTVATSTAISIVAVLYLLTLLVLGWAGYRQRTKGSLSDFYLAGSSLGTLVLFATLYASQYSGNTFLGYTGQAYRIGFSWTVSVGMMMSVVIVYLLFAPALHRQAHQHGFVTPADWADHRFGLRRLTVLMSLIMAVALINYLYAQFLAMGHLVVGMTGGRIPFWAGVLGLGMVIAVYETLGGMRSVAWADVLQSAMLFSGLMVVLVLAWPFVGSLDVVSNELRTSKPAMLAVPSLERCGWWASNMVLMGVGAAMYPHAIQRIYAARSAAVLRRSLSVMVWMPFATTLVVLVVGIAAHAVLPELEGLQTDQVMPAFLAAVGNRTSGGEWGAALVLVGALAAIISTADSALLSLSSIFTCDILGRGRRADEERLTALGKKVSWGIVALLVLMALSPPTTLWRLIEIKMELLIQVAPIVILGVRSPHLTAAAAWRALVTGTTIALVALLLGIDRLGGVHTGTWACAINLAICLHAIRAEKQRLLQARPNSGPLSRTFAGEG